MLKYKIKRNKKAQVVQTLNWVYASLILFLILAVSIALSLAISFKKQITTTQIYNIEYEETNRLQIKTDLAFNLNNLNQREINNILTENNDKK